MRVRLGILGTAVVSTVLTAQSGLRAESSATSPRTRRPSSASSSICCRSPMSPRTGRTSGRTPSSCRRCSSAAASPRELLETAGNPLVFGELKAPGATRTLLLYAHYDGQPVDPPELEAADPFTPDPARRPHGRRRQGGPGARHAQAFEPDWRIYARSASDDKSPIVALCPPSMRSRRAGARRPRTCASCSTAKRKPDSPSLVPAIAIPRAAQGRRDAHPRRPVHPSEKPTLVFGARGIVTIELTVYGPSGAAQRALRQLGPESGDAARAAAGDVQGRRGQRAGRGLLRRHHAADARKSRRCSTPCRTARSG